MVFIPGGNWFQRLYLGSDKEESAMLKTESLLRYGFRIRTTVRYVTYHMLLSTANKKTDFYIFCHF